MLVLANSASSGDKNSNPQGDPNPKPTTTELIVHILLNTHHNKIKLKPPYFESFECVVVDETPSLVIHYGV